jgi:hypothetical protein
MPRVTSCVIIFAFLFLGCAALAQESSSATGTTTCNFDEDKQLVVQYQHVTVNLKKGVGTQVPFGKVWAPGGKPMTLFTNTPVVVGAHTLGIGAYTLFIIPTSKQWTLVVSKSTDMTGAYDDKNDLVRVPMDSGELPNPVGDLGVAFEHVAPGQCNLRLDLDKLGHFAPFKTQ